MKGRNCKIVNGQNFEKAANLGSYSGSVLVYVLTKYVDVLEKMKRYGEAVRVLEDLLSQSLYLPHYRYNGVRLLLLLWFRPFSIGLFDFQRILVRKTRPRPSPTSEATSGGP